MRPTRWWVMAAVVMAGCPAPSGGGGGGGGGGSGGLGSLLDAGHSATGGGGSGDGGTTTGGGSGSTGGGAPTGGASGTGALIPFVPETVQSNVAIDGAGRLHAVALGWAGTNQLVYSTCASRCVEPSSWSTALFGAAVGADLGVAMRITNDGRPRATIARASGSIDYYACESNCLVPDNWHVATAATGHSLLGSPRYDEHEYFALGPSGEAAIYFDANDGKRVARCSANCDQSANWSHTLIGSGTASWSDPHLVFARSGLLSLTVRIADFNQTPSENVGYFECASGGDCANWPGVILQPTTSAARFSTALDNAGRTRIALFYDGADSMLGNTIQYYSCDSACSTPANWSVVQLPFTGNGPISQKRVSLGFDAQNRPWLAYRTIDTASVARCTTSTCVSSATGWTSAVIGTTTGLTAALPFAHPCSIGAWFFDDGHYTLVPQGAGYVVLADIKAVASGGTCNGVSTFEFRSLLSLAP